MKNRIVNQNLTFLALIAGLFLLIPTTSKAHTGIIKWSVIGKKTVDYKLDKDVFWVSPRAPKYRKLQLKVTGGRLNMHKCVVHYMNGTKQNINLKGNFNPGDLSRVIDLNGDKRRIEKVVFVKDEWTPDNNLTTPTLKIKRAKIDERFSEDYENWYKNQERILWE